MNEPLLAAGLLFLFGLVSRRLSSTMVTPPMVFVALGLLGGPMALGLFELDDSTIHPLGELTLVLLLYEFIEAEGQFLMLLIFTVVGGVLVGPALEHATWRSVAYAGLSLTLIRVVPVAISMLGAKTKPLSVLFMGWFGPRGLASILFVLLLVEDSGIRHREDFLCAVILTVFGSVFAYASRLCRPPRGTANAWAPNPMPWNTRPSSYTRHVPQEPHRDRARIDRNQPRCPRRHLQ
ncbi:MAG: hypothetical protein AB8I08_11565 [Sandaracinaceae bacterium]